MIRVVLMSGETWDAEDGVFDLTPLGIRREEHNSVGIKTGEWELIPWQNVSRVYRFKNPPQRNDVRLHAEWTT